MKTETRLARALQNLPTFTVFRSDNDYEPTQQQPVLKGKSNCYGFEYLATIHPSQGDDIQGAYEITQVGPEDYEYRYLNEAMESWAKKYGFRWECIVNDGFFGLVAD
jgi:hypothetical protein